MLIADAAKEKLLRRKDDRSSGTDQDLRQLARKGCRVIFAGRNKAGLWGETRTHGWVLLMLNNILYISLKVTKNSQKQIYTRQGQTAADGASADQNP